MDEKNKDSNGILASDIALFKLWGRLNLEDAMKMISGMGAYEIAEVTIPSREGRAEMITGDQSEKATRLLEIITKAV